MIHLAPPQPPPPSQQQQPSIKETGGNRKLLHRLKRDRSSADRVVATVIATGSTNTSATGALPTTFAVQQPAILFGTQPPDVKRPRLAAGVQATDLGERLLKFSTRSPIILLEEAIRSWETGDRQTGSQRLREFSLEHLRVLPAELHTECASLLLRLVSICRNNENCEACLRFVLNILQSTSSIHAVWSEIFPLIAARDEKNDSSILKRVSLDAAVLSLFEEAVSNSVVSESQLETARQIASRSLHSDDFERRIAAIHFYIAYAIKDDSNKSIDELLALEKFLCDLCEDRDSRVRFAAIRGLSMLSDSRKSLSFYIYSVAKMLSENTEKFVRLEALKILKDFADRQPETEVVGRNNAKLRLVDDAFSVVCHALNDVEIMVRAEAAKLLGTFDFVSDCFLDQTLDKKLLNAMRMSKAWQSASRKPQRWANVRRERYTTSAEWSTGKKLGEDVPAEKIEDEQTSIIPTGACGALITALEDEFMVVRQAAVYSLGRLAADRSFLAAAAIDNLSDMFNDEIEQVRLDAIYALTPLVVHGVLHKEQLDTILTVLDDASPDSREALRVLLMKATLDSPECMRDCVKALLNCLKRFPIDESSIFRCLSDLGRRHGSFIEPLVTELLGLNAVFDITEPELDDSIYMAKLMLILNAASVHDPLCSMLPEFVIRHYRYLRSSMPDLVPFVRMLSDGDVSESDDTSRITKRKVDRRETLSLLESLYEKMCDACKMDTFIERNAMFGRLVSDFDGISETDVSIAGTARFVANFMRMLMRYDMTLQRLSYFGDFHSVLNVIDEGLELLDHCENEFRSVDATLLGVLAEYRFRLRILKIVTLLDIDPRSYVNIVETINSEMDALKERLAVLDVMPSESMMQILNGICEQVEQSSLEKSIIGGRGLLSVFHSGVALIPPDKPSSFGNIDGKWVEIVEPNEPFKDAIRFKAGLPLGVPFNILLHNFDETDVSNFRIKIGYSTQHFTLYRPRQTDIKRLPDQRIYRFMGNILIESNAWSTAGVVRISCVLLLVNRQQSSTALALTRNAHQQQQQRNQPNTSSNNNNINNMNNNSNNTNDHRLILSSNTTKSTAVKCNSNTKPSSSSLSKCIITLMESPFSNKPAYKDIPIYPMMKCSF